MPLRDLLGKLFNRHRETGRARHNRKHPNSDYRRLETRSLLAGIVFEPATGDLYIAGDGGNDVGSVESVGGSQIDVHLAGFASQRFDNADISRLVFLGFGGNDQFTNNSNLPSLQIGGDGDDVLTGGSVFDQINGGRGTDTIAGRNGDDRLIGGDGADDISGGNGNDSIFGNAGNNQLAGNDGDDLIFGGDQIDTIRGGAGVDQIYALAGDDILYADDGGVAGSNGVAFADLILGLDGDDTFYGGDGLNVFYGGEGNDVLNGGTDAENRLHGQNGDDQLNGGDRFDFLNGGEGIDTIRGEGGADYILTGLGNDVVYGGSGEDTTVFAGNYRQYRINGTGALTVRDMRDVGGNQGTDSIWQMERFKFADGFENAVSPIEQVVTVRPIVVSNTNGSATAMFFGNAGVESYIKEVIDDIYYQANVDVAWQSDVGWHNTFANRGNGGTRPQSDLGQVVSSGDAAGKGSGNPLVIDVYFVNIVAGFSETTENQANGLAFVNANGAMVHVGDNLLDFEAGRDVIARVVAHEIAHNLGLIHVTSADNLMDKGTRLTASQINTILASRFTI